MENTATISGNLVEYVKNCIKNAEEEKANVSQDAMHVAGMTGKRVRYLLNNLCNSSEVNYLEIGTWFGSTLFSALSNNNVNSAIAIDNFSEQFWGGQVGKTKFTENLAKFAPQKLIFHEVNSFEADLSIFKDKVNVYFYDGNHSEQSQYLALKYYDSVLADQFVFIVDDYDDPPVPVGTQKAIKELGYVVDFETVLSRNINSDADYYWNGIYVSVLSKKKD